MTSAQHQEPHAAPSDLHQWDFSDLTACFINTTLKPSPEISNTQGLMDLSAAIMSRQGVTVDVIRAVFPGGTITGCPKVRCMEIIAELEGEGRGFYTGSMGYLDRFGNMDLNILIRSMQIEGSAFVFRTGAGIVIDSDPKREVRETVAKAKGLLRALGIVENH